jgi:hypothetical protein
VDIDPARGFMFDFTDEQWSELVCISGKLRESARTEFKDCISLYLLARRFHPEHEVEYRGRRERLHAKIREVLEDREWKGAIASLEGLDMQVSVKPPLLIGQLLDELLNLLAVKLAYRNLHVSPNSSRPGPKSSQPAHKFVANAAALLENYTGKAATRSKKRDKLFFQVFIKKLCAIADPSITSGTIDEALKKHIMKCRQETPW